MTELDESKLSRAWQLELRRRRDELCKVYDEIDRLNLRIAYITGEVRGSDTFADPYSDNPIPLGRRRMIRFDGDNAADPTFDVAMDGDDLRILVNGTQHEAVIVPESSNAIRIRRLPRSRPPAGPPR